MPPTGFSALPPGAFTSTVAGLRLRFPAPASGSDGLGVFIPGGTGGRRTGHRVSLPSQQDGATLSGIRRRDHVRFLQRCARGGGRQAALLDIGCGSGTFLHLARQRGFDAHGMDVSEQAVAVARAQYDLAVHCGDIGSDLWQARAFDFITMFHVLEHLPDPRQALDYAHGLLKPDGSLILQVPNAASLQARAFGARWYGLDVPRHLINFTPRSLGLLLDQAGFSWRIVQRFSLRDNPASIASSLAMRLDPIGRRGRGKATNPVAAAAFELMYFGLFLLALLPAWIESILGHGGTIWVRAKRATRQAA